MLYDIRFAAQTMRKSPVFAAAAVLTLALGIGATTAIFTVVNAVILRPLPFARPERLVRIFEKNEKLGLPTFGTSVLNYLSWKERTKTIEQMGALGFATFSLSGTGEPEQLSGTTITASILPALGIQPVLGRGFREDDEKPGSAPVAMISEGLWRRRFGGAKSLLGKTITLNGAACTLVGIAPAALAVLTQGDVWIPLPIDPGREIRLNHVVSTVGRLRGGVTIEQAQAEMDGIAAQVGQQFPEVKDWGVRLMSFHHWFVPDQLNAALLVLLAAVVLVLLIACANVANLLLSRAAARQKEMAVRIALGAGRGRLVRQLLTESLVLSALGGAAGMLTGAWAVRAMAASLPAGLLPVGDIAVDSTVLLFSIGATLTTGFVFGLAPAMQAANTDLQTVLKQGGRSLAGGAKPAVRKLLVAGELALATALLIGAGLLMQSLFRLQQVRTGFRPERLLTFQLAPPAARYPGAAKPWAFYKTFLESVRAVPGVRAAAASSGVPLGAGNYTTTPATPVGQSLLPAGQAVPIDWRAISPGYFRAMEIPLLRGRDFTDQDDSGSAPVMMISQTTAQKFWGADDPVGRSIRVGPSRVFTVIGVVGDVRNTALSQAIAPAMYFAAAVRLWPLMDVVVRSEGDPAGVLPAVRQRLRELDREMPMSNVRTMDEWISNNAALPRLNSALLEVFAGIALLIAAIGIYGVLSYVVHQRTQEIGVRMALGARRGDVLGLVVREGMAMALAGIGAGLAGAWGASRALASLLFGVEARDPATFAAVAVILSVVSLAACCAPALRAIRVDPMVALRQD